MPTGLPSEAIMRCQRVSALVSLVSSISSWSRQAGARCSPPAQIALIQKRCRQRAIASQVPSPTLCWTIVPEPMCLCCRRLARSSPPATLFPEPPASALQVRCSPCRQTARRPQVHVARLQMVADQAWSAGKSTWAGNVVARVGFDLGGQTPPAGAPSIADRSTFHSRRSHRPLHHQLVQVASNVPALISSVSR